MLYTPLSMEDIHYNEADFEQYEWIHYQNKPCYVQRLDNGDKRVVQLLSTNPNDYLLQTFAPGTIITNDEKSQ
ncbi:YlzJ-like family protein [Gracilibacillus sp. S3-1-1]|uniref:YlzJ-like family protein n=1 Tax=Gracilibacillus pellucidus TaxID=3095368 RepID=A0ACC6M7P0_9BACI|nr:YlzJ-like family protein [Gracilibacillus sp. S3-1-1]MDX8046995.1 YlzJ-like family protein [Gracilibacillus sp. S3-1-1]